MKITLKLVTHQPLSSKSKNPSKGDSSDIVIGVLWTSLKHTGMKVLTIVPDYIASDSNVTTQE